MINILLSGYLGQMGRVIIKSVAERNDCTIVAGVDINSSADFFPFSTYTNFENIKEKVDVIVDFSNPATLFGELKFAIEKKIPIVIATTGLSNEQVKSIQDASKLVPIFYAANMSLGVNIICELAKKAASILYPDFNIEIVETHHNKKVDAPSGTALMLANEISSVLPQKPEYEYNRHSKREKRTENEIGIHSIRAGTIPGEHEIIFAGKDEVVKISHTALSREIFATGGLNAAFFIVNKAPGLYSMKNLLNLS
ncbi:MAG: 4-hydroxy-tetrahydrodipicolinate reductase [Ruminococcaceae bacterium]|nr:4-hydroxy-tetrahydrodipicolinate reductase [Oscillospiraceae bacterium]